MSIYSFDAATNTEENSIAFHVHPPHTPGKTYRGTITWLQLCTAATIASPMLFQDQTANSQDHTKTDATTQLYRIHRHEVQS
jgi:hypothetical protein